MGFFSGFNQRLGEIEERNERARLIAEEQKIADRRLTEERAYERDIRSEDRRNALSDLQAVQGYQDRVRKEGYAVDASVRAEQMTQARLAALQPVYEMRNEAMALEDTIISRQNYLIERGMDPQTVSRLTLSGIESLDGAVEIASGNPDWSVDQLSQHIRVAGGDPEVTPEEAAEIASGSARFSTLSLDDPDALVNDEQNFYQTLHTANRGSVAPSAVAELTRPQSAREVDRYSADLARTHEVQSEFLDTNLYTIADADRRALAGDTANEEGSVEATELGSLIEEAKGGDLHAKRVLAERYAPQLIERVTEELMNDATASYWGTIDSNPQYRWLLGYEGEPEEVAPEEAADPVATPEVPPREFATEQEAASAIQQHPDRFPAGTRIIIDGFEYVWEEEEEPEVEPERSRRLGTLPFYSGG